MTLKVQNISDAYLRIVETDDTGRCTYVATLYGTPRDAAPVWAYRLTQCYNLLPEIIDALNEISEFLDNYVDVVDGDYGEPRPNKAMSRKTEVDALLDKLNRLLTLKQGDPHARPPAPNVRR
jgi:hypothetical protein